jgi:hypothetical protein
MLRRLTAGLAASVALGSALSPTLAQPKLPGAGTILAITNWWRLPGALPAQADLSGLSLQGVRETGIPSCRLSSDLSVPSGTGFIPDTRNIYAAEADGRGACRLIKVLEITPKNPATAQELVTEVERYYPLLAMILREGKMQRAPTVGIVIPFDTMEPFKLAVEFAQASGGGGRQAVGGVDTKPLPPDWAEQPGLLPAGPQGPVGARPSPGGGQVCLLRVGPAALSQDMFDTRGTTVPINSIAIIDTTRAVFIDAQCRVQPLVTIPVRPPASVSGPGPLPIPPSSGPNPNVGQAGGPLVILGLAVAPETATLLSGALVGLGIGIANTWNQIGGAAVLSGPEAQQALANKQTSGQSDVDLGRRAISP